ncbi:MAG: hypothetical protein HY308_03120 [Gammaproteobacteria bacterium]|nr:hypothetical protein [Gammaproteobacteria bacterium]
MSEIIATNLGQSLWRVLLRILNIGALLYQLGIGAVLVVGSLSIDNFVCLGGETTSAVVKWLFAAGVLAILLGSVFKEVKKKPLDLARRLILNIAILGVLYGGFPVSIYLGRTCFGL